MLLKTFSQSGFVIASAMLILAFATAGAPISLFKYSPCRKWHQPCAVAFAIPLNVTLQFAKKGEEGTQIVLAKAEDGVPGLQKALTIVKSVDAEKSHSYKQTQAVAIIAKRLDETYDPDFLAKALVAQTNIQYKLLSVIAAQIKVEERK